MGDYYPRAGDLVRYVAAEGRPYYGITGRVGVVRIRYDSRLVKVDFGDQRLGAYHHDLVLVKAAKP